MLTVETSNFRVDALPIKGQPRTGHYVVFKLSYDAFAELVEGSVLHHAVQHGRAPRVLVHAVICTLYLPEGVWEDRVVV